MKKVFVSIMFFLVGINLSGCALQIAEVKVDIPKRAYPVKVALLIPESSLQLNTMTQIPSRCTGTLPFKPYPFGKVFKDTAHGVLSVLFEQVDVINNLSQVKDYDVAIEATFAMGFRAGCIVDHDAYYQAEGTLKLFDNSYNEVWRSQANSARSPMGFFSANFSGEKTAESISAAITALINQWANEIVSSQQLVAYVNELRTTQLVAASSSRPLTAPVVTSDVDTLPLSNIKKSTNAYAVVIGIEYYRQKLPNASYATQDAQRVSEYLTKVLGYPEENVVTLLNDHATNVDLVKYFEKWLPNNVENGGSVFVYYSGHGAPNPNTGDAYLVPYDGDPSFIDQTGYSLKRMYDALGKLPAKNIVVALDSCFSGAGGRSVLAEGARPLVMNLKNTAALPNNLTVLAAAQGDQISSTYQEKGHGLFTYFLLKGIKNEEVLKPDGSLEITDLYDYIKPQVERIARKQYNNEQTPQLIESK